MADEAILYSADYVLEYPYVRSVGPAIGAFLTGLRAMARWSAPPGPKAR